MNVRYLVELGDEEREQLEALLQGGKQRVRCVQRAQILLAADQGHKDCDIAETVSVSPSTILRCKRRFVEGGVKHALYDRRRPGRSRKLSGNEEALLVATTCSDPPEGRARWTMQLLADRMVELTDHESLSRETVRRRLHENELKPWQKRMWCIPEVDAEFVERMEDVLELYAEEADERFPVVCFDETPCQLIGETREPIPAEPGETERVDYEYCRNGVANIFVFLDANRGWRHVKVTDQRTKQDFAHCMRELVDLHCPKAEKIRVVLDNLNTHRRAALYETFPPDEARRILRLLEFHYTPKHASWLNMVEIEIGVLSKQCLDRRIPDKESLKKEVAAWSQERNESGARIKWLFDVSKARAKMGRSYPSLQSE
jgi:transposase